MVKVGSELLLCLENVWAGNRQTMRGIVRLQLTWTSACEKGQQSCEALLASESCSTRSCDY
jgi:hypothetical protein